MANGFYNGLNPGEFAQCYIHGTEDGSISHPATYLIPDRYARFASVNDLDNCLELIITAEGYIVRDDYRIFGTIQKGKLWAATCASVHMPVSRLIEFDTLVRLALKYNYR